jgi:acetyltransferase-like isoleucine patch superfamily enzyme
VYRGLGVRVGRGAQIRAHCTIDGDPRHLSIGPETFINQECYFDAGAPITIGRRCGIGLGVMILTSVHTLGEDGHPSREPTYEPVTVGDRVGLFARVTVLPGVTIGECVSVAAGAVVTRDLEPWTLYAGVPARKVRSLRPEGSLAD